jgi:hypothetical protein
VSGPDTWVAGALVAASLLATKRKRFARFSAEKLLPAIALVLRFEGHIL